MNGNLASAKTKQRAQFLLKLTFWNIIDGYNVKININKHKKYLMFASLRKVERE